MQSVVCCHSLESVGSCFVVLVRFELPVQYEFSTTQELSVGKRYTAGVGGSSHVSRACTAMLVLQCQC